jgi:hypothetical protein
MLSLFILTRLQHFAIFVEKCCLDLFVRVLSVKVPIFKLYYLKRCYTAILGCGQNYHKRCVVKVPNNCSYTLLEDKQRRRSATLQVPRSPSGGSNSSLASANSTQTEDSGLVRLANFFTGGVSLKD